MLLVLGVGNPEYALAAEPPAEIKEEASARFQKGLEFSKDGQHRAALLEFKRAYELVPSWQVLYNLGQASRELKDHASALGWYERYLVEGGSGIPPKRKKEVERAVAELRPKVASLRVSTSTAGAEVLVDDLPMGVTPLAQPLRVNAGRLKLTVTLKGYLPVQRIVEVAGAEEQELSLELVPLNPTPAASESPTLAPAVATLEQRPPSPPPAERDSLGPWPWLMVGTTGALGVTTAILGARALGLQSDYEQELQLRTTRTELDDLRSSAKSFALATDVVAGVTAAAAITSIVLVVIDVSGGASSSEVKVQAGPTYMSLSAMF
jgi:hypothetical protein